MIDFRLVETDFVLRYDAMPGKAWVYEKLDSGDSLNVKRTFLVDKKHLYGDCALPDRDEEDIVEFKIGTLDGEYIVIDQDVLGIDFSLYLHKDLTLKSRSFVAERNVSIFSRINDLGIESMRIGGEHPDAMPEPEFERLLKLFPNSYELRKYVAARAGAIVRQYFETKVDAEEAYNTYLNEKSSVDARGTLDRFRKGELYKYSALLEKLEKMLDSEESYTEKEWQYEILQIVLLIFPKYIKAFSEVSVRDTYNGTNRSLDFMLVDASGHVDLVEIKKPFDKCIVTKGKYRDNYIPLRELSGTVMQIEKYIFYLNKWGRKGEQTLTDRYQTELPPDFQIRITNPGGILILGRGQGLTAEQRSDFEVIKRKYKNVIDIISYDDLLARLRFTVQQLRVDESIEASAKEYGK